METNLILVNTENEITGYGEKMETHRLGLLHRAFSIFIVDAESGQMLIQRRAASKYHSPGLWTNACCSHPRKDEEIVEALTGRLKEELGLELAGELLPLPMEGALQPNRFYECGSFRYFADFGELKEHEIDRVFLLPVDASKISLKINPEEADQIRWIGKDQLISWLQDSPKDFTQWFHPALNVLQSAYRW